MKTLIFALILTAGSIAGAVLESGPSHAAPAAHSHHVAQPGPAPRWTVACTGRWDVNCTHYTGDHPRVVRVMPGSAHTVCVIHLTRKDARLDYCS